MENPLKSVPLTSSTVWRWGMSAYNGIIIKADWKSKRPAVDVNPPLEEGFDMFCHHQWQV